MDNIQSIFNQKIKDAHNIVDTNLPEVMAGLEMLTVNANLSSSENKQRLRRRIPATESNENLNRRCSLRPRKRTRSEMEDNSRKK